MPLFNHTLFNFIRVYILFNKVTSYFGYTYFYLKVKGVKIGENSIYIGSILNLKNRNFKAPSLASTILSNN